MKKRMISVISSVFPLFLGGCSNKAASIGIIGGADGPTAIFVTSKANRLSTYGWIGVIIAPILIALIIYLNKKKK